MSDNTTVPTCFVRRVLQVEAEQEHVRDLREVQSHMTIRRRRLTAHVLLNRSHQFLLQAELDHVQVKSDALQVRVVDIYPAPGPLTGTLVEDAVGLLANTHF